MNRFWNDESGILTFEWILLLTMLVIGIVGGIAVVRDAYIVEAAETGSAMMALNQSFSVTPSLGAVVTYNSKSTTISGQTSSSYEDAIGKVEVSSN